jgi:hypothetical protein
MSLLIILGIVLSLIVVTFLLLIFMPTPKCYFDFDDIGNELAKFTEETYFDKILSECGDINYDNNNVCMLYQNNKLHCNMSSHPQLYNLLKTVPDIERVFFKQITPTTETPKKRGSTNISNHTLRCVLPIHQPTANKSSMWLDGESRFYSSKKWIIYDDSRESSMHNKHKNKSLDLLVVDITRPIKIPVGISNITHSDVF